MRYSSEANKTVKLGNNKSSVTGSGKFKSDILILNIRLKMDR